MIRKPEDLTADLDVAVPVALELGIFNRLDEIRHPPFGLRLEGGFF